MIQFKSTLEDFNSTLWGYHFVVSEEITRQFSDGNNRRIHVKINDRISIRSALMPFNETESFILVNKKVRMELGLHVGDQALLSIEKDDSKYGMEMPEELSVLLDQENEVKELFHQLTPGKQRSLIYLVTKVKNTNSRLNKALAIAHHLKEMKGQLDYKILNETIKYYNSRGKLS